LLERDAEKLSERVRSLRRRRGLTQVALAGAAGVSRSTVARVELGESNPDLQTMGKLARALGVPTAALLGDE
jgi:transcriptional regulator with XRE-family HTH domain